jgi:hypothetical protein
VPNKTAFNDDTDDNLEDEFEEFEEEEVEETLDDIITAAEDEDEEDPGEYLRGLLHSGKGPRFLYRNQT